MAAEKVHYYRLLSSALILNEGTIEWQLNEGILKPETVHHYICFTAPYFELVEEMTAKEFLLFHAQFKKFINNFSIE